MVVLKLEERRVKSQLCHVLVFEFAPVYPHTSTPTGTSRSSYFVAILTDKGDTSLTMLSPPLHWCNSLQCYRGDLTGNRASHPLACTFSHT
jgi:hypothetical protein